MNRESLKFYKKLKGQTLFLINFQEQKKIQAIDLIAGKYYPDKIIDKDFAFDCNFALSLKMGLLHNS